MASAYLTHRTSSHRHSSKKPQRRPWPAWENDIHANRYHMFYNNAREGSYNG
ncbi:BZ3501_MvSof-1269-A2-R1_Chr12-3g03644 [Microbotryum saponariae]|nr:BZ3501_MvSof-1269-A2-R1_Chr12-3g03644 [Microbotryum saponariae]